MNRVRPKPIFLTWRLKGSLPSDRPGAAAATDQEPFEDLDRRLDRARSGPCHLRKSEVARMVVDSIHHHAHRLRHFDLHAYVVMANHIHLLITPRVPVPLLSHSLQDLTAREAAHRLHVKGPFWQEGCYQHEVHGQAEFERIAFEIEMEPVTAGMVCTPGEFPWTSAAAD